MVGPPGEPKTRNNFPSFKNNGRGHGRKRPFSRPNGVGRALDQSIGIGHTLLRGEVIHLIVQEKAEAFEGDARSERVVKSCCHRDSVPSGIDD